VSTKCFAHLASKKCTSRLATHGVKATMKHSSVLERIVMLGVHSAPILPLPLPLPMPVWSIT
jgi:hypothetical protein